MDKEGSEIRARVVVADTQDEDLDSKEEEKERDAKKENIGKRIWRFVNFMMSIFFVLAAGVQFNDPDPYLWAPLYGVAALLTFSVAVRPTLTQNKQWRIIYWIHAVFSMGMFIYVLVELLLAIRNPNADGTLNPLTYEEGRELAGIMITAVWLFTCKQSPAIRCWTPLWCERLKCCSKRSILIMETIPTSNHADEYFNSL